MSFPVSLEQLRRIGQLMSEFMRKMSRETGSEVDPNVAILLFGQVLEGHPFNASEVPADLDLAVAMVERRFILSALAANGGNRMLAAKALGVTFSSLRYRMAKLDIPDPDENRA
jgi:transcriptional regulator with PAS, ATPase and Fis domain